MSIAESKIQTTPSVTVRHKCLALRDVGHFGNCQHSCRSSAAQMVQCGHGQAGRARRRTGYSPSFTLAYDGETRTGPESECCVAKKPEERLLAALMRIEEEGWLLARRLGDQSARWLEDAQQLSVEEKRKWSDCDFTSEPVKTTQIRRLWVPWQKWSKHVPKEARDRCNDFQRRVELSGQNDPIAGEEVYYYLDAWSWGPPLVADLVKAIRAARRTAAGIVEKEGLRAVTPLYDAMEGIDSELSAFERASCSSYSPAFLRVTEGYSPPKPFRNNAAWFFALMDGIAKRRRILEEEVKRQDADKQERARSSPPKAGARRRGKAKPKPKTISARMVDEAPVSQREKHADWLAKAMLLVRDHPEWSDRTIAGKVSRHPSTLSRSREYQAAAAMARGSKDELRRGHITVDAETGQEDIEAYDDQPGRPGWDED